MPLLIAVDVTRDVIQSLRNCEISLKDSKDPLHLRARDAALKPNVKLIVLRLELEEARLSRNFYRRFMPELELQNLSQCLVPAAFPNLTIAPGVVQDFTV